MRTALAEPTRVVPPARVLRPAVWLKMRSWSTCVRKIAVLNATRTSGSSGPSNVRPDSTAVADENGVARSCVI